MSGKRAEPLRARRCVRHVEREAIARCPSCSGFFCRECVVEHEGKLVCSACLARAAADSSEPRTRRNFAPFKKAAATLGALLLGWWLFYSLGMLFRSIPPDLHDATVWKKGLDGSE